jgi:hypothetical protein
VVQSHGVSQGLGCRLWCGTGVARPGRARHQGYQSRSVPEPRATVIEFSQDLDAPWALDADNLDVS